MSSKNQKSDVIEQTIEEPVEQQVDVNGADAPEAPTVKNPVQASQFGDDFGRMLTFDLGIDEAAQMTIGKYAKRGHDGLKVGDALVGFDAPSNTLLAAIATLPSLKATFADGAATTMQTYIDTDEAYQVKRKELEAAREVVTKLRVEMREMRVKAIAPFDESLVDHTEDAAVPHRVVVVTASTTRRRSRSASTAGWGADHYPYYIDEKGNLVSTINPGGYGDVYIGRVGQGTKAFGLFAADETPILEWPQIDANGVPVLDENGNQIIVAMPVGDSANSVLRAWLGANGMGESVSAPAMLHAEETEQNPDAFGLF